MIYKCEYQSEGPQSISTEPTKKGWAYFDFTCVPDDESQQKSALVHLDIELPSMPGWLNKSWIADQNHAEAKKDLFWIAVNDCLKKWLIQKDTGARVERRLKIDRDTFPNYPYPERLNEELPKAFSIEIPSGKIDVLS